MCDSVTVVKRLHMNTRLDESPRLFFLFFSHSVGSIYVSTVYYEIKVVKQVLLFVFDLGW